jgi:hypothetical protein
MGDKINACKVFVEKPEGRKPFGRSQGRRESSTKMCIKK